MLGSNKNAAEWKVDNEDMREMEAGFVENLKKLTVTTIENIQERQQLLKIKKSVNKEERNWKMKTVFWNNMSKKLMTYMQFTLWVEQLERDQQLNKERETENKEWWRLKNLIKDVEGTIALSLNQMHRRKVNFMRLSRKEKVCQHYADGLHKFWWKKLRRT